MVIPLLVYINVCYDIDAHLDFATNIFCLPVCVYVYALVKRKLCCKV